MDNLCQNEQVDITAESLWDNTKEILKAKFKNITKYEKWIEPLQAISFEDNVLKLHTPNIDTVITFQADYVEYAKEIVKDICNNQDIYISVSYDKKKDIW